MVDSTREGEGRGKQEKTEFPKDELCLYLSVDSYIDPRVKIQICVSGR